MVQDSKCSWSKRLRMYNQFVQGNAELLSISSDDSIWNSDSDEDDEDAETGQGAMRRQTRRRVGDDKESGGEEDS